jgi:hypothetical protein
VLGEIILLPKKDNKNEMELDTSLLGKDVDPSVIVKKLLKIVNVTALGKNFCGRGGRDGDPKIIIFFQTRNPRRIAFPKTPA